MRREESRLSLAVQWVCIVAAGFEFGGKALALVVRPTWIAEYADVLLMFGIAAALLLIVLNALFGRCE